MCLFFSGMMLSDVYFYNFGDILFDFAAQSRSSDLVTGGEVVVVIVTEDRSSI